MPAERLTLRQQSFEEWAQGEWERLGVSHVRPEALKDRPPIQGERHKRTKAARKHLLGTALSGAWFPLYIALGPEWSWHPLVMVGGMLIFYGLGSLGSGLFWRKKTAPTDDVVRLFADEAGLRFEETADQPGRLCRAWGQVDGVPGCVIWKSSSLSYPRSKDRAGCPPTFTLCAAPCDTTRQATWSPDDGLLDRGKARFPVFDDGETSDEVQMSGSQDPGRMEYVEGLTFQDEELHRLVQSLVASDAVITLGAGRLEAWFNRDEWAPGELSTTVETFFALRTRLTVLANTPTAERLLFLVMNADRDLRERCLAALNLHFSQSEECTQANAFSSRANQGNLMLVQDIGGGELALSDDPAGALSQPTDEEPAP